MKFLIRITLIISLLITSINATAQLTAENAFIDAPNRIFPMIDSITRLDMIDYFNSGSPVASKNAFEGESKITEISPEKLQVRMSDASDYQIIILPAQKDSIIALITTLYTPIKDSYITFYNRKWEQLDKVKFEEPTLKDWLTPEGKKAIIDVENTLPFLLVTYFYDPSTATLMLSHNMKEYLPNTDIEKADKWLKSNLKYQWTGKKMKPLK